MGLSGSTLLGTGSISTVLFAPLLFLSVGLKQPGHPGPGSALQEENQHLNKGEA